MAYNEKIDGYNIITTKSKGTKIEERLKDVKIVFYSNHEIVWKTQKYEKVSDEKIELIKKKLYDYTLYNLNEDEESKSIPFSTIISEVQTIIFN